jgi:hypothetical protein
MTNVRTVAEIRMTHNRIIRVFIIEIGHDQMYTELPLFSLSLPVAFDAKLTA